MNGRGSAGNNGEMMMSEAKRKLLRFLRSIPLFRRDGPAVPQIPDRSGEAICGNCRKYIWTEGYSVYCEEHACWKWRNQGCDKWTPKK